MYQFWRKLKMTENQMITINNVDLPVKEYHNQRVLTFKDIDTAHERPNGTAGRAFRHNRKHFIEGEDYFTLNQPDEIRLFGITRPQGGTPESVILITESGYLMLAKSFTDDLSWTVQRGLVNSYFRTKDMLMIVQTLSNEVLELKFEIINAKAYIAPTKPDYWRWKNSVSSPLIKQIADKLGIEKREAFDLVYDTMSERYGFDRSFAINQMCCKYGTAEEYVIDAIADNSEYQRWFFETATSLLNIAKTPASVQAVPCPADKVHSAILPIINKYKDKSANGARTYGKVYNMMTTKRGWAVMLKKNGCHSKKELLNKRDDKFKQFCDCIESLMAE